MTTPEGLIKDLVAAVLAEFYIQPASSAGKDLVRQGWYYMPSQNGFGTKGVPDFLGHYRNHFFAIEAKAPKKKPTGFQQLQITAISISGGRVFVIDGPESLRFFQDWLDTLTS